MDTRFKLLTSAISSVWLLLTDLKSVNENDCNVSTFSVFILGNEKLNIKLFELSLDLLKASDWERFEILCSK